MKVSTCSGNSTHFNAKHQTSRGEKLNLGRNRKTNIQNVAKLAPKDKMVTKLEDQLRQMRERDGV
jgi:hypothetical protein